MFFLVVVFLGAFCGCGGSFFLCLGCGFAFFFALRLAVLVLSLRGVPRTPLLSAGALSFSPLFYRRLGCFYRHIVWVFLAFLTFFLYLCRVIIKFIVMVKFSDLVLSFGGDFAPMALGVVVIWSRSGSCVRVPASVPSLSAACVLCSEWSLSSDSVESVSFWSRGVLVCRCSASLLFGVRSFVGL